MRLSEFIHTNHEIIIKEWVNFARTMLPWSEGMSEKGLKDHAEELLTAVVSDMKTPQSNREKSEKSKGNAVEGELAKIGQKHASDRLESGLDLNQLVSEYRALRASVLRLWEEAHGDPQGEVTRFNEAIDETLSTSTARYYEILENTREQFLGILGHDLRNPIGAVIMGAELLRQSEDNETVEIADRMLSSGERMNRLVMDLLDLTRTRLGSGIPVIQKAMDLGPVCNSVISELQIMHPHKELQFQSIGDLNGEWDSDKMAQAISNLVSNAIQHGATKLPIKVVATGQKDEVVLQVHNFGHPIPDLVIRTIFEPMARFQAIGQRSHNETGLGLGLFIASEIVSAHRGTISVTSSEKEGTTFTIKIPRHPISKSLKNVPQSQN